MAENIGLLLLGGIAVFGILWYTGALCQQDIANGALCPPGKGVWQGPQTGQRHLYPHAGRHTAGGYQPGQAGPPQGQGYGGDDSGYGDDAYGGDDYSSYAAHISIA